MSLRVAVAYCTMLICCASPAAAGERLGEAHVPLTIAEASSLSLLLLDQQTTSGTQVRSEPAQRIAAADNFRLSAAPSWLRATPAIYDLRGFDQLPARDFALADVVVAVEAPLSPDADAAPYRWNVRDHLGLEAPRHRKSALDATLTLRLDSAGDATPGVGGGVAGAIWKAMR